MTSSAGGADQSAQEFAQPPRDIDERLVADPVRRQLRRQRLLGGFGGQPWQRTLVRSVQPDPAIEVAEGIGVIS